MDPITTNLMRAAAVVQSAPAPSFINATSGQVTTSSGVTLTLSGLQANDVVIYTYASDENPNMSDEESSGFSGWTEVSTGYSGTAPCNRVRYKITGSNQETLTFSSVTLANRSAAVCMFAFRHVDTSNPVSDVDFSTNTNTTQIALPTQTIPAFSADTILVGIAGLDSDSTTTSPPSGFTEIVDQNTVQATLGVAYKTVAPSTTESGNTFTFGAVDDSVSIGIVLTPA